MTAYTYNQRGQITSVTNPDGTVRFSSYDNYGNNVTKTNELGKVTTYTFDEYKRVTSITDPLGRTTEYSFGLSGGTGSSFNHVDNSARKVTSPSGRFVKFEYNNNGWLTTRTTGTGSEESTWSYSYDAIGSPVSTTDPLGNTDSSTFDATGRRTSYTNSAGATSAWVYDLAGNKISETYPDGNTKSFEYDSMNRTTKIIDQLGGQTVMTYDKADNLTSLTDPKGHVYTFTYDKRNMRLKSNYPDSTVESYVYDLGARIKTFTSRSGAVLTYSFDSRNREIKRVWSDGTAGSEKTYDATDHMLTTKNSNALQTFTRNDAGQVVTDTQKILATGISKSLSYSYDEDGRMYSVTYPDGKEFVRSYNSRGEVATIQCNLLSAPVAEYSYDLVGQRTKISRNNGTISEYKYDSIGKVTEIKHSNGAGVFDRRQYGYNSLGSRIWEKRLSGLGDAFSYDAKQQVIESQYDASSPDTTPTSPAFSESVAYDPVGSREAQISPSGTTAYSVNNVDQYTNIGGTSVSSDSNGNLTNSIGISRVYDAQNRLTSISSGSNTLSMVYDARNRCISRTFNGTTTNFTFLG